MIAEALKFLTGLKDERPITVKVDGREYEVEANRTLGELVRPPEKPALEVVTLTGFVDAVKRKLDGFDAWAAVHVVDATTVRLISLDADGYGRRHVWLEARCTEVNPFPFNTYQTPEMFLINLQSGFLPTENIVQLQRLASCLTNDSTVGTQDDGMSQTVTAKQGAVTRAEVKLPTRIDLMAYRSFREIDPVTSEFMVRLKGNAGQVPTIALLEIDAGKWRLDTMQSVARWLGVHLSKDFPIIA